MNTTQARRLAEAAMTKHGLTQSGWVFQWDGARKRHGQCNYTYKVLSFSRFLTEHAEEDAFMGTVMHEIAHALAGSAAGHGPVWKRQMRALGQSPERCRTSNEAQVEARKATSNYVITCAVTGAIIAYRDRLVKQRKTKRGTVVYKGHKCMCHGKEVLYNGRTFQDA